MNDTEATLVLQVLHALMECGLEPSKIGVICPFRSQVRAVYSHQNEGAPWLDSEYNLTITHLLHFSFDYWARTHRQKNGSQKASNLVLLIVTKGGTSQLSFFHS